MICYCVYYYVLRVSFILRFIVILYDSSPVRGCDHQLVSCFHNSSRDDDSLLKSKSFKIKGCFRGHSRVHTK